MGGPDGHWTEWAECLEGQRIYALSARVQPFQMGEDNTGVNNLQFKCRSEGHEDSTTLKFGDKATEQAESGYVFVNGRYIKKSMTDVDDQKVVTAAGPVGNAGGW